MRKFLIILLGFIPFIADAQTCNDPLSPISTRVYFVNGMNANSTSRGQSTNTVANLLGSSYDVALSTNNNDKGLDLLLELSREKLNEPSQFWEYLANINSAPTWYKEYFYDYLEDYANAEYSVDRDLRLMVDQYLRDLRSGKKIILVAHSQGNFYANNAVQYISQTYPQYSDSMSIVAVGTPAARVLGSGRWHTNALDVVIEGVRAFTTNGVLQSNFVQYTPQDISHHSFRGSYIPARGPLIKQDVMALDALLTIPVKDPLCDRTAEIQTLPAKAITHNSATLEGNLTKGSQLDVWFVWGYPSSAALCSGLNHDGNGSDSAPARILVSAQNLKASTTYYYQACAKGQDGRVSAGGIQWFTTAVNPNPPVPVISCSNQSYAGGTNGLAVTVNFGTRKGLSSMGFETFSIPDKLDIYKHNTNNRVAGTSSFVSGFNSGSFTVDSSFSKVDVVVTGNSNVATLWEITITCP